MENGKIFCALTEILQAAKVGMLLDEARIPISEAVKEACEILGLRLTSQSWFFRRCAGIRSAKTQR